MKFWKNLSGPSKNLKSFWIKISRINRYIHACLIQIRFWHVEAIKMTVRISVLWKLFMKLAKKWPEILVKWPTHRFVLFVSKQSLQILSTYSQVEWWLLALFQNPVLVAPHNVWNNLDNNLNYVFDCKNYHNNTGFLVFQLHMDLVYHCSNPF